MVVSYSVISVGTVSEAIVHPCEVFLSAVLTLASGVIVAHNHPSGNHLPSKQDIETTKRLAEAGRIMGIQLVDHIIIGFNNAGDFYSMKENGYI
jgi:DNA repair protein RadC